MNTRPDNTLALQWRLIYCKSSALLVVWWLQRHLKYFTDKIWTIIKHWLLVQKGWIQKTRMINPLQTWLLKSESINLVRKREWERNTGWPFIHGRVFLVRRKTWLVHGVRYCTVAYIIVTFYNVPEQHGHVYLVGL